MESVYFINQRDYPDIPKVYPENTDLEEFLYSASKARPQKGDTIRSIRRGSISPGEGLEQFYKIKLQGGAKKALETVKKVLNGEQYRVYPSQTDSEGRIPVNISKELDDGSTQIEAGYINTPTNVKYGLKITRKTPYFGEESMPEWHEEAMKVYNTIHRETGATLEQEWEEVDDLQKDFK